MSFLCSSQRLKLNTVKFVFQPDSQQAIVGSNSQTFLQLFDVGENELTKSGEIVSKLYLVIFNYN